MQNSKFNDLIQKYEKLTEEVKVHFDFIINENKLLSKDPEHKLSEQFTSHIEKYRFLLNTLTGVIKEIRAYQFSFGDIFVCE